MTVHKPIREGISPRARSLIERMRAGGDRLEAIVNAQTEDFKKFNETNSLKSVIEHLTIMDREEVVATDNFSKELLAEDKLLADQEDRWEEEDKQRK